MARVSVPLSDGGHANEKLNTKKEEIGRNDTYLCPVVAGYFAEGLVAIDDGIVDYLSIGQEETAVCCIFGKKKIGLNSVKEKEIKGNKRNS